MFRAVPVSNKILSRKWEEHNKDIHYKNLRDVRPTIDSSCPATYNHLKRKAKKTQMVEGTCYIDRYTEIERGNRILLEKMSGIMHSSAGYRHPQLKKSLNKEARKRKLIQITLENQALLKRLQQKQPIYNVFGWEHERKRNEKMLQFICEYPYQLGAHRKGNRRLSNDAKLTRQTNSIVGSHTAGTGKRMHRLSPLHKNVVFKKGLNIGGRQFLVEIHQHSGKVLVFAYDVEAPDSFSLELSVQEATELVGDANYTALAQMLALEGDELVLVDPRTRGDEEGKESESPVINY